MDPAAREAVGRSRYDAHRPTRDTHARHPRVHPAAGRDPTRHARPGGRLLVRPDLEAHERAIVGLDRSPHAGPRGPADCHARTHRHPACRGRIDTAADRPADGGADAEAHAGADRPAHPQSHSASDAEAHPGRHPATAHADARTERDVEAVRDGAAVIVDASAEIDLPARSSTPSRQPGSDARSNDLPIVTRFEARAMGSPLSGLFVGLPADPATALWEEVRADIEASEEVMSRFRDTSEITRLNGSAGSGDRIEVSRRLYVALAAARRAWRATSGLFDPRVITDLDRLGYRGVSWDGRLQPAEPGTRPTRPWLDADARAQAVTLCEPVDLGGIGKGLALRWAAGYAMRQASPAPAGVLIEAGGDIIAAGSPAFGRPAWTIGIEDPIAPGRHFAIVDIRQGAVCTSAPTVVRWTGTDGRAAHHLIDPRTGESADTGIASVTVAAADPAWAEVWSKTLYLVGAGRIAAVARRVGLAAWWVATTGEVEMTPAARPMTTWTAR